VEGAAKSRNNNMFRDFYIGQLKDNGDLQELIGGVATRLKGSTPMLCFDSPLSPDAFLLALLTESGAMSGRNVAPLAS
jgi:hypothetical protein